MLSYLKNKALIQFHFCNCVHSLVINYIIFPLKQYILEIGNISSYN